MSRARFPRKMVNFHPLQSPLVFFFFVNFSPALYYLNAWNRVVHQPDVSCSLPWIIHNFEHIQKIYVKKTRKQKQKFSSQQHFKRDHCKLSFLSPAPRFRVSSRGYLACVLFTISPNGELARRLPDCILTSQRFVTFTHGVLRYNIRKIVFRTVMYQKREQFCSCT